MLGFEIENFEISEYLAIRASIRDLEVKMVGFSVKMHYTVCQRYLNVLKEKLIHEISHDFKIKILIWCEIKARENSPYSKNRLRFRDKSFLCQLSS